jgi:hypothetical protein
MMFFMAKHQHRRTNQRIHFAPRRCKPCAPRLSLPLGRKPLATLSVADCREHRRALAAPGIMASRLLDLLTLHGDEMSAHGPTRSCFLIRPHVTAKRRRLTIPSSLGSCVRVQCLIQANDLLSKEASSWNVTLLGDTLPLAFQSNQLQASSPSRCTATCPKHFRRSRSINHLQCFLLQARAPSQHLSWLLPRVWLLHRFRQTRLISGSRMGRPRQLVFTPSVHLPHTWNRINSMHKRFLFTANMGLHPLATLVQDSINMLH